MSTVEDLTISYEENGIFVVKEVSKAILSSKGGWVTALYRFQEWNAEADAYGPDKFSLRRYKKSGGEYRVQSKFSISNINQARALVEALTGWITEIEEETTGSTSEDSAE